MVRELLVVPGPWRPQLEGDPKVDPKPPDRRPGDRPQSRAVAFEALESRLLLSADLLPAADALAQDLSLVPAEHRALDAAVPAPQVSMRIAAREVVFVDGGIPDRERLLADFLAAAGPQRTFDVVMLDPGRDGIAQIGAALAGRTGLAAVHVLGHGADGALSLGRTTLDAAALAARADAIARWGDAFAADGDFLLYGCNLAASARGAAFVTELARLTGADVAASDDPTGAAARGGDWDLERTSGAIESALPPLAAAGWGGLLATEVLDWDAAAVDWPGATTGSNSYAVGGANVTVTVTDPAGRLNNFSPDDDTLNDEGGLGAIEQGLYVSSTGFLAGESATITIDFAHAGGVSNASFTIFDIDTGGAGNFVDEIQAAFTASGAVTLAIANGPNNTVVGGDTVQGTATTPSTGAGSGDANATFTFTGSGITQIVLTYRNVGGATGQSVTLHDISFDPSPTAADRTVTTGEDASYAFAAADFGFADAGGDTLQSVRITQLESAGSLQLNGVDVVLNQVVPIADINANRLTFAPAADANGAPYASFRFRVGDGASYSAADHEMRVDVSAVGDTVNDAATANEDGAITVNVLANDNFESAGRALTAVAGAANGTVGFTAAGVVTYTPNAHWNGAETLTYTVASGGATETGTLTVTVAAVNDAPTLSLGGNLTRPEDAPPQTVVAFATAAPGGGTDEAGQTFTYAVANDNNALFAVQPSIAANGTLTYTLAANAIGTANVTVSVTDSGGTLNGGMDTTGPIAFSITATPVADSPSVTNAATLEDVQTTAGLVLARNAADGAEVTHFRVTGIAGGTLFQSDGTTPIASGDFITFAQGAAGLRFTPGPNSVAAGSFDVQAATAGNVAGLGGGVVSASIVVTPVNDEPSFTTGGNLTIPEDSGAQTLAAFATAAPGGGADEAAQTFTYTVANDNNALFAAQPSLAPNGTLTYTLAPNASGAATVTLSVTDSGGVLNGGDDTAPAQSFTITATPVADAPVLTLSAASGNEDTAIALSVATALVDGDGSETLAVTVSSIPIGATVADGVSSFTATAGNTSVAITGWNLAALTVTPPAQSDVDFTLAIAATATETANGATATTGANLAVTVDAVADAPAIVLGPAAGNEDTAIALAIGASLVDADGSEALALALSAIPVGAVLTDGTNTFTATAGSQSVSLAGWSLATLSLAPPANADADFTLTVAATATEAANGATATATAALLVDVLPVNDAPTVAAPAAIAVVEDVASPLLGISFADVDAGAGPVTATFTVAQGTLAAAAGGGVAVGGTATARTLTGTLADVNAFLAGGGLSYTTLLDATAPVALTASLDDLGNSGAGGPLASPTANVTLNVIPVNDAPVLGAVTLTVDALGTVVLTGANLSATDVDDPAAGLVFFITSLVHGRFELVGAPGVPVTSFTQGQVLAGQVQFVQTDPARAPSYLVFVTDGASTVGPGVVALSFRPLDPGVATPPWGGGDAPAPAVSFASSALAAARAGLAEPFAIRFGRQPVAAAEDGGAAIAEAETVAPVAGARQASAAAGDLFALRPRGFAYPEPGFGGMDKLPTAIAPLELGVGPQRPHEELRGLDLVLDSVRTAGMVLSVGAVWWAARAAGLLSSLIAISPTWRHLDPLPVLGRDDDEPAGGWEEPADEEARKEDASADRMFERNAGRRPA